MEIRKSRVISPEMMEPMRTDTPLGMLTSTHMATMPMIISHTLGTKSEIDDTTTETMIKTVRR